MSLRLPRKPPSADTPYEALEYEIAQEQASTLGRVGRRLEAALAALVEFDAEFADGGPERRQQRARLIGEAGEALWYLIVQRESLGLRDTGRLLSDYRVPREVRDRMGIVAPRR